MNPYFQKIAAKKISPLLTFLNVHRLFAPLYGGIGQILMFHRIIPEITLPRVHNHESLEITVKHFEEIIKFFKILNYQFISLNEFYQILLNGTKPKSKVVHFTFDDGYIDNYQYVYPLLKKYNIPFTIYISVNFPEKRADLWWYYIEDKILENDFIRFEYKNITYNFNCSSKINKEVSFHSLRKIILSLSEDEQREFLLQIKASTSDHAGLKHELWMNWDQIKELSEDPLVEIGSHTINHPNLSTLTESEAIEEIEFSKKIIESKILKPVNHFCYPFGKKSEAGKREYTMAKRAGYKTAVTTRQGNIFLEHKNFLHSLPRITINSLVNKQILQLQTNGVYPMIINKFKRL